MPGQGHDPEALDRLWALLDACAADGQAGDVLDVQMSLKLTRATRASLGLLTSARSHRLVGSERTVPS